MVAMILLYEVCMYVKFDTNNNITKKYQILLRVIHNSRFMCKVQVQNLCLRWRLSNKVKPYNYLVHTNYVTTKHMFSDME